MSPNLCAFAVVFSAWAVPSVRAQPSYVYDNSFGTVNISGAENDGDTFYNWTVKYPLGFMCEDPNWIKTVTLRMTAKTSEADLVLAIGTNTEYFAVAIPYDKGMRIPLRIADSNGDYTVSSTFSNIGNYSAYSGLSVVPPPGSNLLTATTTLEEQYLTDTDFRRSLVPSGNAWEWEHLVSYDSPLYQGPFSINTEELVLEIFGDRDLDRTQLTIFKNGHSVSIQMTSTWPWFEAEDMFLFLGMDAATGQQEVFELRGIDSVDNCTSQTVPTSPITLSPTADPTAEPTAAPTESTADPSTAPSAEPTATPSSEPSDFPTLAPSDSPSAAPILAPTASPSAAPTASPTVSPSIAPTVATTESPTVFPTVFPTAFPTAFPTVFPTAGPTLFPSEVPTVVPSAVPSAVLTAEPTASPTASPSSEGLSTTESMPTTMATHSPTTTMNGTVTTAVVVDEVQNITTTEDVFSDNFACPRSGRSIWKSVLILILLSLV